MSTLLATPSAGWSHLSFPNFDTPLSYIDDVALLLLQDFILTYLDKQVAAVTFDCEGYDTTLVLSNYDWTNGLPFLSLKQTKKPMKN